MAVKKIKNKKPTTKKRAKKKRAPKLIVGWREKIALPGLNIPEIKAKIDTGAKTSALHAFRVVERTIEGKKHIEFCVHPDQQRKRPEIACVALLKEKRKIRSSNGSWEQRYVIETPVTIGVETWLIELSLTNRDEMDFRMLLGREAMKKRIIVDPGKSYLMKKETKS